MCKCYGQKNIIAILHSLKQIQALMGFKCVCVSTRYSTENDVNPSIATGTYCTNFQAETKGKF